ncbi:RHS repeat-associated protein [Anaerobacterium chartisolvens]|uniref:RHS repeat-associated protein n=1 Tax=Anaerobacterium chartisolvens TaxID=1297424 RepID=A0A369AJ47_9FIRM|nr:RHS repeat-associated protein [Anaerobacterium chartisolvens]
MYSDANMLLKLSEGMKDASGNEVLQKTTSFWYDDNGNQITETSEYVAPENADTQESYTAGALDNGTAQYDIGTEMTTNSYDGFNRLKSVDTVKGGTRSVTEFVYNGNDLRVRKTVKRASAGYTPEVTNYLYDRQHVILETDASENVKARYIRGINYIAMVDAMYRLSNFLYNGHGDVVQTVSEAGQVENRYDYDIFGSPTLSIEEYRCAIRYAGEFYDEETGLYYLRARYYDPYIGRFISEDTYTGNPSDPLSLNLYTYCHNEPIMYVDPTGHKEELDKMIKSTATKNAIDKATKAYEQAKAKNDKAGMTKAHDDAEKARSNYAKTSKDAHYIEAKYGTSALASYLGGGGSGKSGNQGTGKDSSPAPDPQPKPNVSSLEQAIAASKGKGNSDIFTTRLTNKDFLKIVDGSITYYGGDQDWFKRYTQNFGGCGPTSAANILAYMAMTDPEIAKLYGYDTKNITKADFAKFMEQVYKYVTPLTVPISSNMSDKKGSQVGIPSLGITSLSDFTRGVEKFAQSKEISLKSNWSSEKPTFNNAVSYIREGLGKDKPVALLNMFNPVDMQWTDPSTNKTKTTTYEQHWVTITGITENKKSGEVTLEVSSWGGRATLSFNSLYNNMDWNEKFFPAGIMYFEHKK